MLTLTIMVVSSVGLCTGGSLCSASLVVGLASPGVSMSPSPGGCLFAVVAGTLCAGCILHARSYGGPSTELGRQADVSITVFMLASLALLLTDDVLVLGTAFELQSVPLVLLLITRGPVHSGSSSAPHPSKGTGQASLLFVAYATFSGVLLYAGLGGAWFNTGTLSLRTLLASSVDAGEIPSGVLWCALVAGYVKVAACPTHLWLTKVHVEASTVGSTLLAGLGLKVGYYIHLLLWPALRSSVQGMVSSLWVFLSMGAVGGAVVVCWQVDLKRWVATFSILHVQLLYMIAVMTLLTPPVQDSPLLSCTHDGRVSHWSSSMSLCGGMGTSVTYGMLGHSYVAAGLFLLVGTLADQRGARTSLDLAGDVVLSPGARILLLVLLLANGAYPGTSLFVSEVVAYMHAGNVSWWSTGLMISVSGVSLAAGVHVWLRTGGRGQSTTSSSRSSLPVLLLVSPLGVTSVLMGLGLWTPLSLVKEGGLCTSLIGSI